MTNPTDCTFKITNCCSNHKRTSTSILLSRSASAPSEHHLCQFHVALSQERSKSTVAMADCRNTSVEWVGNPPTHIAGFQIGGAWTKPLPPCPGTTPPKPDPTTRS